jgi:hypothetical protein
MKKILMAIILIMGFSIINNAEAQKTKFFYYPSSNVYYNPASGKYIYNKNGQWTTVKSLPAKNAINSRRVIVYSSSPQVWTNNSHHVTKYKAVKMKPMPPGQIKAKGKGPNK